jgi:hypothetical protein
VDLSNVVNWGELGFVALFVIFLIYDGRVRQARITANHEEWRQWLSAENKRRDETYQDMQVRVIEAMGEWRAAADAREQSRSHDTQQLVHAITRLEANIEHITSIILLVYARIQAPDVSEAMTDLINQRQGKREEKKQ